MFGKKGDVSAILKNIFTITPVTDCLTIIIPILAGMGESANPDIRPCILPQDMESCVSRKQWADNWAHITASATDRCSFFSHKLVENLAMRIAIEQREEDRSWLLDLLEHFCSLSYYKLLVRNETYKKENRICTQEELAAMEVDVNRIVCMLLRSAFPDVIAFLTSKFSSCCGGECR